MRTAISQDNPFPPGRAGYAWEKIPATSRSHLDFGCNQGRFLHRLEGKQVCRLVGVDVARGPIEVGKALFPSLELHHLDDPHHLPFQDASFDSASILDVLEHVEDQKYVLNELHRVLVPGGVLIITVPGKYALSFMDLGNLKFRFPRLHRWVYCLRHSREEYDRRYVHNPDGLVGDVSASKQWHEHFTQSRLEELLQASGFRVIDFDGSGYFTRALSFVALPIIGANRSSRWLQPLYRMDSRLFASMNLFCTARKQT